MKRETSKEKEALLTLKERPAKERSPFSAYTNPPAPTSPSRQFHSIPSIYERRRLLAIFLWSTARLSLPSFYSRHAFWKRFFLSRIMTFSKAELCSQGAETLLLDCICDATVDYSYPFSPEISSSSSLCLRACWTAISFLTRSSNLACESQAVMLLNSAWRCPPSMSLACQIYCRAASRCFISFWSLSIFSSKEQMKGMNSSIASSPSAYSSCCLAFLRPYCLCCSACWMAVVTVGHCSAVLWISCFCSSTKPHRAEYSCLIHPFYACRQSNLHRISSAAPPSSSSRTDRTDILSQSKLMA